MTDRATRLLDEADAQLAQLTNVLTAAGETGLHAPCQGREKLGDGSVGAVTAHFADNYLRIAAFVREPAREAGRPPVRRMRAAGLLARHRPPAGHGPGIHQRDMTELYAADKVSLSELLERLRAARAALRQLAELTDEQLDAVPPATEMRFADGQRTLEQVIAGLLKHQRHQCDAVLAAVPPAAASDP